MDQVKLFNEYLNQQGLKNTSQRMVILEAFLASDSHLSTEELYLQLRADHPKIGYATVHRTLKLFAECGIAAERNFGDGQTRFEPVHGEEHHDHLICTKCGLIIEFEEPQIEKLQESVAAAHHFTIKNHRLELYGLCAACAADGQ
ncbi:ferric uptake regulator, Fur family [Malonomonas rubra DSM 5091]|uniref:Ferric uptake regulation protein n=1 Tax=Malonomonas rubra DSM 5091 TaxID=1122189 RepID=A0A1M6BW38_MALRU|nr:transcriptional repressor [Malonomonas rubra]SHI52965.1 ferric uptake regulator, Fur family [Malonomonas rubra DSM 5091]